MVFFSWDNIEVIEVLYTCNPKELVGIWRCNICGDAGIRLLSNLEQNHTNICLCHNKQRKKDYDTYIGKQYNHFTILDVIREKEKHVMAMWLCDCGNYGISYLHNIVYGSKKSCGHITHVDYSYLVNTTIGYLTILYLYVDKDKQRTMARCQCKCGNKITIEIKKLLNGNTKSCGCYNSEIVSKRNKDLKKLNNYRLLGNGLVEVELSNTKNIMIVDEITWNYLKLFTWYEDHRGYANTKIYNIQYYYHMIILDAPEKYDRDHIDRNPKNNTYANLRVVTHQENMFNRNISNNNSSGINGVYYDTTNKKWVANINIEKKCIGKYFDTFEEAAQYRKEQEKLFYQIHPIQTERLVNSDGSINANFPFHHYPDIIWKELQIM